MVNKKKALIFGITGQDGSYMTDFLLAKGYDVHGVARRTSVPNTTRFEPKVLNQIHLHSGDVTDAGSVTRIISEVKPDEIYNFAAMSHVHISWAEPSSCFQSTAVGCLNCLEAIRTIKPDTRYFYAGSSEQFGDACDDDGHQRITTPFNPRSPYAVAKTAAFQMTKVYRESFGLYAASAICFNHESPRRGENFVTRKITKYFGELAAAIINDKVIFNLTGEMNYPKLHLGTLTTKRDWSHARDCVDGFWRMMQLDKPEDFVFSSMETHTIQEFLEKAYAVFVRWLSNHSSYYIPNLSLAKIVEIDPKFIRPLEVPYLLGDSTYTREKLGWKTTISFDELVYEMVNHDIQRCNNNE
jgi:GDPmannose 4,6-dehydratase